MRPAPTSALPLWALLASVGIIVGISMGRTQSMGLYLPPITGALGVGRESFGFSLAITQLLIGIGAPVAGAMIDRFGAARIVVVCALATIVGLWFLHAADSASDLLVSGVLMGIGVSGTGVTSLAGAVGRFAPPEKRLAAIASIGMAAGIGGFVALPVVHLLIGVFGWQGSLLWLMGITALLLPAAWPIRGRRGSTAGGAPEQTLAAALREALGHRSYWLLTLGFSVCGFHVAFVVVHLPAFAIDQGLPAWVGPVALSVVGIANIVGTYLAGQSGRFFEKRRVLSFIYLGRAVLFLAFLVVPITPASVIAISGLLGLLWLSTVPLTGALVGTFFGTAWMSMLFGVVFLSHQVGSFLGVWLGGRLYDATGSYDLMWTLAVALGVLTALVHWPIEEKPVARLAGAGAV